jgi:hypothetical protein
MSQGPLEVFGRGPTGRISPYQPLNRYLPRTPCAVGLQEGDSYQELLIFSPNPLIHQDRWELFHIEPCTYLMPAIVLVK